jgi:hypothetical protein
MPPKKMVSDYSTGIFLIVWQTGGYVPAIYINMVHNLNSNFIPLRF